MDWWRREIIHNGTLGAQSLRFHEADRREEIYGADNLTTRLTQILSMLLADICVSTSDQE